MLWLRLHKAITYKLELNSSNMRKILLFINILLCCGITKAQQTKDKIYYNKNWESSTKENAEYYRIISKERELFHVMEYHLNGTLQMNGYYKTLNPEIKEGLFTYYDENGKKSSQGNYFANTKNGPYNFYYKSGLIWFSENYSNGILEGECTGYFENGQIKRKEKYRRGELIEGKCYTSSGLDTSFYPFETMPEFIGGNKALFNYLGQNINYPPKAREKGIEGKVILHFVVSMDGQIKDIEIIKYSHALLDQEALRVVKSMPKWKPGFQDGKAVEVKYTLPISFKLN